MRTPLSVVVLATWVSVGCVPYSGSRVAEVTGRVTQNGEPVEGLLLTFYPEQPADTPAKNATAPPVAYGRTDADGRYRAFRTGHKLFGAIVGRNRVSINPPEEGNLKVPAAYSGDSGPVVDVQDGANTFDIDLKVDPATKSRSSIQGR